MIGIGKSFTGAFVATLALIAALWVGVYADIRIISTFRTTNLLVDSTATISTTLVAAGQIQASNTITPPAFTGGTTNDYAPTGLATAYLIKQTCNTANETLTGLLAQPLGTTLVLTNEGPFNLLLSNSNGGSAPLNQFVLPAATGLTIEPGYSIKLRYAGSDWEVTSWAINDFFTLNVSTSAVIGQLRYGVQAFPTTGVSNNVTLNTSTTIFNYTGTADATITGLTGGGQGRVLVIQNGSGHNLTLPNLSGSSLAEYTFANVNGADIVLSGNNSSASYTYDGNPSTVWRMTSFVSALNGAPTEYTSTKNKGTIALAAGTGSATVQSGSVCTCSDTTGAFAVQCPVSSTTLTANGNGNDTIAYLCF